MIRKLALLISLTAISLSAQTVDEIIAKHIEARGGAAKMAAIKSLKIEGRIKFGTAEFSPIVVSASRPSNFRVEFSANGNKLLQGYDGKTAWQGAAPVTGAQRTQVLDQAISAIGGPLVDYKSRGNHVEYPGHENWKSHDTIKLKVTLSTGTLMIIYLDPKTYLEVGEELYVKINGVDSIIEETVADDKPFGGVLFPTTFVSGVRGQSTGQRLEVQSMTINPVLSPTLFRLPGAAAAPKAPAAAKKGK